MTKIKLNYRSAAQEETAESDLMTVKETARYLRLSDVSVYRLVKECGIPSTRIGRKIVFSRRMLDEWLQTKMQGKRNAVSN